MTTCSCSSCDYDTRFRFYLHQIAPPDSFAKTTDQLIQRCRNDSIVKNRDLIESLIEKVSRDQDALLSTTHDRGDDKTHNSGVLVQTRRGLNTRYEVSKQETECYIRLPKTWPLSFCHFFFQKRGRLAVGVTVKDLRRTRSVTHSGPLFSFQEY